MEKIVQSWKAWGYLQYRDVWKGTMKNGLRAAKEKLLRMAKEIEKSVSLSPNLQMFERLSKIYYALNDHRKACDACLRALNIDRENITCCEIYGMSLLKLRKYEEAILYLEGIAYTSNSPTVAESYAIALCNVDRLQEALIHVERQIEKDPRNPRFQKLMDRLLDIQSTPPDCESTDEKRTTMPAGVLQKGIAKHDAPEVLHMDSVVPFPRQPKDHQPKKSSTFNSTEAERKLPGKGTLKAASDQSSEPGQSRSVVDFSGKVLHMKESSKREALRRQQILNILKTLQMNTPDIEGAAVISAEGLPISSSFPTEIVEERVSVMAAAMLSLGERTSDELQCGGLDQVYVKGKNGYILLNQIGAESALMVVTRPNAKLGMIFLDAHHAASELAKLV